MVCAQVSSLSGAQLSLNRPPPYKHHIANYRIIGTSLEIIFTADDVGPFPDLRIVGRAGETMGVLTFQVLYSTFTINPRNALYPDLVRGQLGWRLSYCDMSIAQSQRADGDRNRRYPTRRNTKASRRSVGRARASDPPFQSAAKCPEWMKKVVDRLYCARRRLQERRVQRHL